MKDFIVKGGTLFENGDIRVGISDEQNKGLLLKCPKGSFKEFPTDTVGASDYLENEDITGLLREVRTKFVADGMTVNKIVVNEQLIIDANY